MASVSLGEPVLETRDLWVQFGGLVALKRVNIKINRGELRALIGPNGAGKTTFFNAVTGLVKPTRGEVIFEGRNIVSLPPHKICRQGLSRSFQLTSVFPELTVFENVWLGLNARNKVPWNPLTRIGSRDDSREKVKSLCEMVGLRQKLETLAGNISQGDQKLVELAITLSLEPRLVLLDEPTQGVSPHEVKMIIQVVRNIAKSRTVLIIDHNMSTIREVAEIVSVLHYGEIIVEGTPEEVVEDPKVREVYLGTRNGQTS
ncbi:MAG: ABC transporter ATP-binding protein [Desulfobacterales bacterium]|nr:MAG: ABC transporter ATP-binding protein [Desulfobacterales bacterium]